MFGCLLSIQFFPSIGKNILNCLVSIQPSIVLILSGVSSANSLSGASNLALFFSYLVFPIGINTTCITNGPEFVNLTTLLISSSQNNFCKGILIASCLALPKFIVVWLWRLECFPVWSVELCWLPSCVC